MADDKHYTYYFCYGTAVGDRDLEKKIDTMRLEGWGRLDGWRMDFSRSGNQPNILEDGKSQTWGLMMLVESNHLQEIDKVEDGGERREGKAYFNGVQEDCIYYVHPQKAEGKPDEEYLKTLRESYRVSSLPQKQIDTPLGVTTVAR